MHQADIDAGLVLRRLQDRFGLQPLPVTPMPCADGVLVGLEVEVPWSAYFPTLWSKYFLNGALSYADMDAFKRAALSTECSVLEAALLPRLEAAVGCGIKRGRDRYWEFVLPPVSDACLSGQMIEFLTEAGLLPRGIFSLHATISGIATRRDAFLMLLLLELLFGRKERVVQGCRGLGAWARKGDGGIVTKINNLLYDSPLAYELRTLELPPSREERTVLLSAIARATRCFSSAPCAENIRQQVKELIESNGLPFKPWGSPRSSPEIWERYLENFDSLKSDTRDIALSVGLID